MAKRFLLVALSSLLSGLVTAQQNAGDVEQPEGWDEGVALAHAIDLNPDPKIVEIELEAKITEMEIIPGTITPVWTYNGTLPGPLITVNVGDRLIVHFKNSVPATTSIHWHGMRLPNNMDGAPGLTQDPIETGGEFTYDYVVADAGTYWYHPHIDSAAQVGYGLYGPIVVNDPADPKVFGDDLVLMLSDMSLEPDGRFKSPDAGTQFGDLFGREGEILLVNGKVMPELKVRQGKQQRWRVINATRARYYTLRYKRIPLYKLGGDNGLAARTNVVNEIKIIPGERADFVFTPPDAAGTEDVLKWYPTDRGYGTTFNRLSEAMMTIKTVDEPAVTPATIPEQLRDIEPIDISVAVEQEINLTIVIDTKDQVIMGINGVHHDHAVPIEATVGQTQVWNIRNDTDFAHPFHLHGFFFQVLDDSRVPEWKDTVDVPSKSSLKIAVTFDNRPGMWMYHCHILDHAEAGMMGHLHVAPADSTPTDEHADHGGTQLVH
ncbi:MAG: multicopper oxidase family protein [Pseudomonadota bacterium]